MRRTRVRRNKGGFALAASHSRWMSALPAQPHTTTHYCHTSQAPRLARTQTHGVASPHSPVPEVVQQGRSVICAPLGVTAQAEPRIHRVVADGSAPLHPRSTVGAFIPAAAAGRLVPRGTVARGRGRPLHSLAVLKVQDRHAAAGVRRRGQANGRQRAVPLLLVQVVSASPQ